MLLVVWDDWGGWYDHVDPKGPHGPGFGYPNGTASEYVYGFRVPLLVVSTYARQAYISNTIHDFGSILRLIEQNFSLLGTQQGIYPTYPYADQFSGGTSNGTDSLADFFQTNTLQFKPINLYNNSQLCNQSICGSNQCDATCFINYNDGAGPQDPDDD